MLGNFKGVNLISLTHFIAMCSYLQPFFDTLTFQWDKIAHVMLLHLRSKTQIVAHLRFTMFSINMHSIYEQQTINKITSYHTLLYRTQAMVLDSDDDELWNETVSVVLYLLLQQSAKLQEIYCDSDNEGNNYSSNEQEVIIL